VTTMCYSVRNTQMYSVGCERGMKMLPYVVGSRPQFIVFACICGDGVKNNSPK
jgi:hypothetical protein